MSIAKTKTERRLHRGGEYHLSGSGDLLVTIYRCANDPRMTATINCFLLESDPDPERDSSILDMRGQVNDKASTRAGPKHDRHAAAVKAIDGLATLAGLG